jgi:hypothetical protein
MCIIVSYIYSILQRKSFERIQGNANDDDDVYIVVCLSNTTEKKKQE